MGEVIDISNDFTDFLSHVEYLGYTIEKGDDDETVWAVHASRPNMWMYKRSVGIGILAGYKMGQNSVRELPGYLELLNQANDESSLTKFFTVEGEPNLKMRAIYCAPYEKKAFSVFMDNFHADCDRLRRYPKLDYFAEDEPGNEAVGSDGNVRLLTVTTQEQHQEA